MGKVIKVENLSKQYRLGEVGAGTLKDDFKRLRYRLMGKEDPFLKIGELNDRTKKSNSNYVWALKDVNFEIEQGDVVGIIGRNGAGKSTLLKILSRTTSPTTGSVKVKGRIASLLEVGTGFHGELSGRENIYLNGAIMGLRKWEIDKKLDEIIDFAGVEKYLDTPVKRYSSGMYVRLAFSVAAHLDPDILIVDEVLSVGDAEFQKKCLGKIKNESNNTGRSIFFVTHNMYQIEKICNNVMYLENGVVKKIGSNVEVLKEYYSNNYLAISGNYLSIVNNHITHIKSVDIITDLPNNIQTHGNKFAVKVKIFNANKIKKTCLTIRIQNSENISILDFSFFDDQFQISGPGLHEVKFFFPSISLYIGIYKIECFFAEPPGGEIFENIKDICAFEVIILNKSRGEYEWQNGVATYIEKIQTFARTLE